MLGNFYLVHMDDLKHDKNIVVVADRNIPFLDTLIGDSVTLKRLKPEEITADVVKEADALITRTRTRCDSSLLDGSRCKLVATATIGTDHIDFDYCNRHGIKVVSAPGCNAPAVAQYVWSVILRLAGNRDPHDVTVGVVGVGHVGSIVVNWGRSMGFNMLLCDPPRQVAEQDSGETFVSLEDIARSADFITFHTPLIRTGGNHPTFHLASTRFFDSLQRKPVIINSARGPVVDTYALIEALGNRSVSDAVIDCWEGEPDINLNLLAMAVYATPHIAVYSVEGKARASIAVSRAVAEQFGVACNESIETPPDAPVHITAGSILESYDPSTDTQRLKTSPSTFELQRNNYNLRPEPEHE